VLINVAQDAQQQDEGAGTPERKQEEPEKVRIVLRHGDWTIEVEAPAARVREVVEDVLAGMARAQPPPKLEQEARAEPLKPAATCRGLVERLWSEGWFSQERVLSEVDLELRKRGYNYDRSAIAHVLAELVREGLLARRGEPRRFTYIQKRPPGQGPSAAS